MGNHDPQVTYQPFDKDLQALAASGNGAKLVSLAAAMPAAALTASVATVTSQAFLTDQTAATGFTFLALSSQLDALSDSPAAIIGTIEEAVTLGLLVKNLQTRMNELEAREKAQGLLS